MTVIARVALIAAALAITVSAIGCRAQEATAPAPPPVLSATEFLAAATDYPRDGFVEAYVTSEPLRSGGAVEFDVGDDTRTDFSVRLTAAAPSDLTLGAKVRFPAGGKWPGGRLQVASMEVVAPAPATAVISSLRSLDVSLTLFPRMEGEAVSLLGKGAASYIIDQEQFGRLHVVETTSAAHAERVLSELSSRTGEPLGVVQVYRTDGLVALYVPKPDGRDITAQLERELGTPNSMELRRK